MGAKKRKWPRKKLLVCVFLVATYGNEVILVGGHKKHTVIYGAVHAFQSTIQNLSLKKGCAEDQNSNCHGRRSSRGRALRLYLACILPD